MAEIPAGFEPLFRSSPYTETIGPLYHRKGSAPLVLAVRILDKHANARGFAHGGLLLTLADLALGYAMAFREDPPASLITASLSADFAGTAKVGDWVEAHVDIQKSGSRLAFANAYLTVGGERILRASAVFARMGALTPKTPPAAEGG
ncbi:MAG TPA: hotdog domain-containing protein [Stellaceae bacterium]|nr:hotdog domain-containing protein [Stellaceae bacterium]